MKNKLEIKQIRNKYGNNYTFSSTEKPKILKSKIVIKPEALQKLPVQQLNFRNVLSDPVNDANYNPYLKRHLQNDYEY